MDQLYNYTGTIRSINIEKSLFKRLGPFWKEEKAKFFEKREFDSNGRLILCETPRDRELYAYLAGEGEPDFRRAAVYRFSRGGSLRDREIWHYSDRGALRGKEIYEGSNPVRFVEIEEDRQKGVFIEKEEGLIRGKQFGPGGRLQSEYVYRGSEADLIIRYAYTDEGHLLKKEETDRNGNPVKTTWYGCNDSGLILEIRETDSKGELLYHRIFEYPGGDDENWLIREEYALNGRGKKLPLSIIYRSLNYFHEPHLVMKEAQEEQPAPMIEVPKPPEKEDSVDIQREEGTLVFSNGYYRGDLCDGRMEGKGTFSFNDGSRYRGSFSEGKPEGTGELAKADGSLYRGAFKKGMMHGKGIMQWADGSRYEGPFINGLMEGLGIYTWANGDRFKGLFEKGRRTDQGLVERG